MQKICLFISSALAIASASAVAADSPPPASAEPKAQCSVDALQKIAPQGTNILSADQLQMPTPFCKIVGTAKATKPDSTINFTLSLPTNEWNGRYYFMGLGGAAGFMPPANPKLLGAGFALAVTDTGHQGTILDWSFAKDNPTAMLDHAHRAGHVTAVATQALTRAFYGAQKMYRYMLGCSGGGRMTEQAIERYPDDFDGAVVGAPGLGWDPSWFTWTTQQIFRTPNAWVSPAKLALIERTVIKQCASPNGLVADPNSCGFDPASLLCKGGDGPNCLTKDEVDTVKAIALGPPAVYPGRPRNGFALTNPTGWTQFFMGATRPVKGQANPWAPSPPTAGYIIANSFMRDMFIRDPKLDVIDGFSFDNPADVKRLAEGYDWADLSPRHPEKLSAFNAKGGKVIYWHGIADPGIPVSEIITHYNDLQQSVPGSSDFARLFLAPGTYHCGGGMGPQDVPDRALEKLIAWRERDIAPDTIVGTGPSVPEGLPEGMPGRPAPDAMISPTRTVLMCAYPKTAKFNGRPGDFGFDAGNYSCVDPK